MNPIETYEYSEDKEALYLNDELKTEELQELQSLGQDRVPIYHLLTTKFKDRVFYKQTDYDYEFGTMSWEEYLVHASN